MTNTKVIEANVNASIDVGKNITSMLEKIADKIGTTVDKIFPWYVKQEYISAIMSLFEIILAIVIGSIMLKMCYKKASFKNHDINIYFTIIGFVLLIVGILCLIFGLSGIVTGIMNPEYHALQSLVSDMSKLVGK
jgi:formate-dependent nitrite reductase membrane component NrfD